MLYLNLSTLSYLNLMKFEQYIVFVLFFIPDSLCIIVLKDFINGQLSLCYYVLNNCNKKCSFIIS